MSTSGRHITNQAIDFHVHAFPDHVVPNALEALTAAYEMDLVTDGTVSGLLDVMQRDSVIHSVILPVATKPEQVESINNWAASHTDPRITCFGSIHPEYNDIPGEIERMIWLGLKGIKIQANWQGTPIDDPKMYEVFDAARGRLIISFHAGREPIDFDPLGATPQLLAKVHADFPDLTMVAAHMGGFLMWEDAERYLIGKNLYLDTSACFYPLLPDEDLLRIIRKHGVERVLFGTDSPLAEPGKEIARLARIGLTDDELELVLCQNAKRLLGMG